LTQVGIFVTAVQPGSPAAQQGLQVNPKSKSYKTFFDVIYDEICVIYDEIGVIYDEIYVIYDEIIVILNILTKVEPLSSLFYLKKCQRFRQSPMVNFINILLA
jgi:hypothetical protein